MKVIVVGGGIAGLSLALSLGRAGHQIVLAERAGGLRGGGYMLDFFGIGCDAAARLGLTSSLEAIHLPIPTLSFLRPDGSVRFRISYEQMRARLFNGQHFNFMRGDLEKVLFDWLGDGISVRFGESVEGYEERKGGVIVQLSGGSMEEADLLVGADGVHSRVRALAFGDERHYVRQLGYHTAAYVIDDADLASRVGATFATLSRPGCQLAVYPIREGRVATFWVHRAYRPVDDSSPTAALRELAAVYGGVGWIVPHLIEQGRKVANLYFADVCQVELPSWSRGRAVLIGDACGCVSLLAGQGASIAMGGAWMLAEAIEATGGNVGAAVARYEERMRPVVAKKQKAGRSMARWFVPETSVRLAVRDGILRASSSSLGSWVLRRQIAGDGMLPV